MDSTLWGMFWYVTLWRMLISIRSIFVRSLKFEFVDSDLHFVNTVTSFITTLIVCWGGIFTVGTEGGFVRMRGDVDGVARGRCMRTDLIRT